MADAQRQQRFTELFDAYYPKVLAYARRRLDRDAASDAVADALLAAWRNLDRLTGDPLPWLYSLDGAEAGKVLGWTDFLSSGVVGSTQAVPPG